MTNNEIMKSYLRKYVFPGLYEKGFTGKWPHFRRELDDCIELITFQINGAGPSALQCLLLFLIAKKRIIGLGMA